MDYKKRIQRLAEKLRSKGKCIVVTSLPNLKYFFDYPGKSFERFCCGLVSTADSKSVLVVPKLDDAKAEESAADNYFSWTDSEGYESALSKAFAEVGFREGELGCEDTISLGQMKAIEKVKGAHFESESESISAIRLIKDQDEIKALKEAARSLSRAYDNMDSFLKPGVKESDAASEIKKALKKFGAEEVDFCAVQSGSNGAIPHLETTEKKIKRGDMVVVDITITGKSGYFADYTRTFSIGKPSPLQKKVYEIVKEAQAAGIDEANSGSTAQDIDRATRRVIEKAGYAKYFTHRTGHGIGIEVHEPPWIKEGNEMELKPGMAFTVEPGIYLPGKFGVRIEDNLLIQEPSTINLTRLDHELVQL